MPASVFTPTGKRRSKQARVLGICAALQLTLELQLCGRASHVCAAATVAGPGAGTGRRQTTNAAWVYDSIHSKNNGEPGAWVDAIASYNKGARAQSKITTVFSYGGDMELYPKLKEPYQSYFDAKHQEAARRYAAVEGVDTIIAVLDGRMDGGKGYSPDLSKLTVPEVQAWADHSAEVYCAVDVVAGIQMDLEPFDPPYIDNLIVFIARLSQQLRSAKYNCVGPQHPKGRTISAFFMANVSRAHPEIWDALGANGYATISGYDLSSAPAGTPSTPAAYGAALVKTIDTIRAGVKGNGSWMLGLPAAASCHEFEKFVRNNGQIVEGYSQLSYIQTALRTLDDMRVRGDAAFAGVGLWGFAQDMAYPPNTNNTFYPQNPFATKGEEAYLQQNL